MTSRNWATHCDTDIRFFESEREAWGQADHELGVCRREAKDGWDEDLAEGIVVMKVAYRATKIDPDADYRIVDYRLSRVDHDPLPDPSSKDLLRAAITAFEAIVESRGIEFLIDAASGSGMSHLGFSEWMKLSRAATTDQSLTGETE